MADARRLAAEILSRCDAERLPCEPLLAPMLARSGLDARDRRLVTILVQATHRWRGRVDRVLDQRLRRGVRSLDPRTLAILRMGYVQLFHLDKIPPHAAVHSAVDATWRASGEGKSRLVNKILRGLISRPPSPEEWRTGRGSQGLEGEHSHPAWLLDRWRARWGEERMAEICSWNNASPDLHLRVTRRAEIDRIRERLAEHGLQVRCGAILSEALRTVGSFDVRKHPLLQDGSIVVQDESQMLVGRLWPDEQATPVCDLCAAPGTKTSQLAEQIPDGLVVAADPVLRRVRRIAETAERLGLGNVRLLVSDGRRPPLGPRFRRVLVDAPCTTLGVLRRRPDARWLRAPGDIADHARLQRELLDAAAGIVSPGGWLLYSVCTLEPEETERQTEGFRQRHPGFAAARLPDWVPAELVAGEGVLCVLPGTMEMEGVYAALFQRREESGSDEK